MSYSKKQTDKWREIEIKNITDDAGLVVEHLFELGCLGINETSNGFLLYFDNASSSDLAQRIGLYLKKTGHSDFKILDHSIQDEDWHLTWKDYFKPQKISEQITIYPEWWNIDETVPIPIKIRPGMAFGTGTHETTQLALQLLEKYSQGCSTLLDAGCGAGILTIAAKKLGIEQVTSVEIDQQAKENFDENLELNQCTGEMVVADVTDLDHYEYDLIVSNIQIGPNTALLEKLAADNFTNPMIFTGILADERAAFRAIVNQLNHEVVKELTKNEWAAFVVIPNK